MDLERVNKSNENNIGKPRGYNLNSKYLILNKNMTLQCCVSDGAQGKQHLVTITNLKANILCTSPDLFDKRLTHY